MWQTNENNHPPPTTGTKAQLLGDSKWPFSQPIRGHQHPLKGYVFTIQQGRQRIARLALLPSIWSFSSPPLYLHALLPASQRNPKQQTVGPADSNRPMQKFNVFSWKPALLKIMFENDDLQLYKLAIPIPNFTTYRFTLLLKAAEMDA